MKKNTVGAFGPWLEKLCNRSRTPLTPRNRSRIRSRLVRCLAIPEAGGTPRAKVHAKYILDGLSIEHLSWQLPYGPRTEAIFLKPVDARRRLPAVLGLHSHGGKKDLGWQKIARGRGKLHPRIRAHVNHYNGGVFWANELAKRGFVVLVHDIFAFASRRVRTRDVLARVRGGAPRADPRAARDIRRYNEWASRHESVMAKALFDAGTTWPGVVLAEDQRALDYLCSRPDVDPRRVGCGGLSGGGLRTVYLAGLDRRVRCAVCVGYMTTWRDMALNQCWTNTWMVNVALVPNFMDFPEILGLRAPRPTLVLNTRKDQLYTLPEMKRADRILRAVYRRARAPERYRCSFYPGPHKFDQPMQAEAFAWFQRWL